jgi:hypothetical protein
MVSNLLRAFVVALELVVPLKVLTFTEPIVKVLRAMAPSPSEPELVAVKSTKKPLFAETPA